MTDRKPERQFCNASTKQRAGGLCQRPAGWGTDHPGTGRCKLHGGATPGAHRAEYNEARAVAELTKLGFGMTRPVDPQEEILRQLMLAANRVTSLAYQYDMLHGEKQALDPKDEDYSKKEARLRLDMEIAAQTYDRERHWTAKIAKAALDAGVARRQVELAERQGSQIFIVVQNVLVELGLPPEVQTRAKAAIAGQFRVLAEQEATG